MAGAAGCTKPPEPSGSTCGAEANGGEAGAWGAGGAAGASGAVGGGGEGFDPTQPRLVPSEAYDVVPSTFSELLCRGYAHGFVPHAGLRLARSTGGAPTRLSGVRGR